MAQDPEFRRRMNRFTGSMVIMAALYCSVIGVTCLLGAKGIWAPGTLVTFQTVLTVAYVAYTIRVSFAAQEFQNEGVGRVLSK
jgi:antibiotic biosynthesis monooxygenase (ABM) superfamily enzyme